MMSSHNNLIHRTPTKSFNNLCHTENHTTPQVQGSKFLFYSPPEHQNVGRKHPRGDESATEQETSHYHKASSRLRNFTVDIKSPYLVEKLEFSSPPPTQSSINLSTANNLPGIAKICHTAIQLRTDDIDDCDEAVMDTVTVRAEQEDSQVGHFCTWDEHWWVQRPLVKVNRYALCILEDALYNIELDIGPAQMSDNMDSNSNAETITNCLEMEEKDLQYTHLLVLSRSNVVNVSSKSAADPLFSVHCTIPVEEFACGGRVSLSLRARDRLLLLQRPNPHDDSCIGKRRRPVQQLDDDADAVFPVIRLRKLET